MNATADSLGYRRLMDAASDPTDLATLALGGVLARFQIRGLDGSSLTKLLGRYFPGAPDAGGTGAVCRALETEEFEDLLALLRQHRRDDCEETEWLARAVASACAGGNHLWEDMGLPNRDTLSRLLRHYFTTLYYKNTGNLRWKKFFYKQLCDRAETRLCKAPSCAVCSDYALCFGPE
ncbi:MAG: nitrogen fixation protein NifQ [Gammaproteobacteria bacterium]